MKKPKGVELYFIIYLATIVSFFTIEGELRSYKSAQKDILYQVSTETAGNLIKVFTIDKSDMKREKLEFDITGDFKKESLNGKAVFRDINNNRYSFPLKQNKTHSNIYSIDTTKKTFIQNDVTHYVSLDLNMTPEISDSTLQQWGRNYGDIKIARKIRNLIQEKGALHLNKDIAFSVVPEYGSLPPFKLTTEGRASAILGTHWTHNVYSSGALDDPSDIEVSVMGGGSYKIDKSKVPTITISGNANRKKTISILGKRLSDNATDNVSFTLDVVKPTLAQDNLHSFCIGEPITYNGSLVSFPIEDIYLVARGDFFPKPKTVHSHQLSIDSGFDHDGRFAVEIMIKGNPTPVLTDTVVVKKPAPPKVELVGHTCNLYRIVVTVYCNGNELDGEPIPQSGIKRIREIDTKPSSGKTEYTFELTLRQPRNKKSSIVEFKLNVYDTFESGTEFVQKVTWDYGCDN